MNNLSKKALLLAALTGLVITIAVWVYLTKINARPNFSNKLTVHNHEIVITDKQKHQFEHQFAEQCVQREIADSTDKTADAQHWQKPCLCIASYLMKGLTAHEAKKFLDEEKSTQSLTIKYQAAAYHCVQAKPQPKAPDLFARPHQS